MKPGSIPRGCTNFSVELWCNGNTSCKSSGDSPNGKASGFDPDMKVFDPLIPCQIRLTFTKSGCIIVVLVKMLPSSRGLGHHPFTVSTRVRISLGTPLVVLLWKNPCIG